MRLGSQSNRFLFNLPQDLIPEWMETKFKRLMDKHFIQYDSPINYLSSTIKDVTFPSLTFNTVEQIKKFGKKINWRESQNIHDKFNHELNITYRSVDSHMNYFMLMEVLLYWYSTPDDTFIPILPLYILDKDGDITYTVIFREVILKSISEKTLAFNKQTINEDPFTVNFVYNFIDIRWQVGDENDPHPDKLIYDIPINFVPGLLDGGGVSRPFDIRPKV